jgi:hypothetical protein
MTHPVQVWTGDVVATWFIFLKCFRNGWLTIESLSRLLHTEELFGRYNDLDWQINLPQGQLLCDMFELLCRFWHTDSNCWLFRLLDPERLTLRMWPVKRGCIFLLDTRSHLWCSQTSLCPSLWFVCFFSYTGFLILMRVRYTCHVMETIE